MSRSKGDVALFFNFGFSLEQVGKIVEAADQYKIAALSGDTLGQLSALDWGKLPSIKQFDAAINAFQTVLKSEFNPKCSLNPIFLWQNLGFNLVISRRLLTN